MDSLNLYRTILSAPNWQTDSHPLSFSLQDWLCHQGSLTEKLQKICPRLRVELIQQGWQAVDSSQNFATYWQREVLLKGEQTPWIFAQTIVPSSTIENVAQPLLALGEQPIGLWLFPQNPARLSLEWRQDPHTELYARRSQLSLQGYPLEIRELFLAQFPFADKARKE